MSFLDDEILLNQLVEETLGEKTGPLEMTTYELTYHRNLQCYQVELANKLYTFPSNWGPFVKVHERIGEGFIIEGDMECFNSVFGSLVGDEVKTAFLFSGSQTFLVFIPKKMETNLKDLHSLIFDKTDFKLAA
ncbi:MAG: hypothetical protein CME70_07795 [Halobacteriovorax sp.]|nr:hypothetical protein [Halobacteriovorax sp.]|tara:strand:- start:278265 stop:278663 length:399 start_codon:yes stop_codon:yes gene_type:complete